MLNRCWRCRKPNKMGASSEESHNILKVQDDFLWHIPVPLWVGFVKMVNQRGRPTTKEGYRVKQNLKYVVRRIHKGARVGFIAEALSQRIMFRLGELLKSWHSDGTLDVALFIEAHQLPLVAFDATNRGLEQSACVGGVTHQMHRKIVLENLQIPVKKRDVWLSQGLASKGIIWAEFPKQLEDVDAMSKATKAFARHLGLISKQCKIWGSITVMSWILLFICVPWLNCSSHLSNIDIQYSYIDAWCCFKWYLRSRKQIYLTTMHFCVWWHSIYFKNKFYNKYDILFMIFHEFFTHGGQVMHICLKLNRPPWFI